MAINGTTVLTNLDIYATPAAKIRRCSRHYTATANSSGNIVIPFTTARHQPALVTASRYSAQPRGPARPFLDPNRLTATAYFFERHRLELVGGHSSSELHRQLLQRLRWKNSGLTPHGQPARNCDIRGRPTPTPALRRRRLYYYVVKAMNADGASAAAPLRQARRPHHLPRGSLGADGVDGNRLLLQRHRPELDGGHSTGKLHDQFVYRLRRNNQQVHSTVQSAQRHDRHDLLQYRLAASTTYYYVVKAVDAYGTSAASKQQPDHPGRLRDRLRGHRGRRPCGEQLGRRRLLVRRRRRLHRRRQNTVMATRS